MIKGCLENKHWAIKLTAWVSTVIVLTLVSFLVWFIFPDHTSISSLKWLQFLQTCGTFLCPPLIVAWLCYKQPSVWLGLSEKVSGWTAITGVCLIILAIPGINLLSYLNQQMVLPSFLEPLEQLMKEQEEAAALLTERFLQVDHVYDLLINIGLMALLPAMAEELTFRGMLVSPFRTKTAIWCSAILFSAIHFQFYGFVPRMLLGALFGYALLWSGSLWLPVLMHFTNNCVAVLAYFITERVGINQEEMDAIGTNDTLWLGIVSLVVTAAMIYLLHKVTKSCK